MNYDYLKEEKSIKCMQVLVIYFDEGMLLDIIVICGQK